MHHKTHANPQNELQKSKQLCVKIIDKNSVSYLGEEVVVCEGLEALGYEGGVLVLPKESFLKVKTSNPLMLHMYTIST